MIIDEKVLGHLDSLAGKEKKDDVKPFYESPLE